MFWSRVVGVASGITVVQASTNHVQLWEPQAPEFNDVQVTQHQRKIASDLFA